MKTPIELIERRIKITKFNLKVLEKDEGGYGLYLPPPPHLLKWFDGQLVALDELLEDFKEEGHE